MSDQLDSAVGAAARVSDARPPWSEVECCCAETVARALIRCQEKLRTFRDAFVEELHLEPASLEECYRWVWEFLEVLRVAIDPNLPHSQECRDILCDIDASVLVFAGSVARDLRLNLGRVEEHPAPDPAECRRRLELVASSTNPLMDAFGQATLRVNDLLIAAGASSRSLEADESAASRQEGRC